MLGHAANSVTGRYIHHLDSVLIAAADKVALAIAGFMNEEAPTANAQGETRVGRDIRVERKFTRAA